MDERIDEILAERQRWVEYEQRQARFGYEISFAVGVAVGLMIALVIFVVGS